MDVLVLLLIIFAILALAGGIFITKWLLILILIFLVLAFLLPRRGSV